MGATTSYLCSGNAQGNDTVPKSGRVSRRNSAIHHSHPSTNRTRAERYAVNDSNNDNENNAGGALREQLPICDTEGGDKNLDQTAAAQPTTYCTKPDQVPRKRSLKGAGKFERSDNSVPSQRRDDPRNKNTILSSIVEEVQDDEAVAGKQQQNENHDSSILLSSFQESPQPQSTITPPPQEGGLTPSANGGNNSYSTGSCQPKYLSLPTAGSISGPPISPTAANMDKHNDFNNMMRHRQARPSLSLSCSLRLTPQPEEDSNNNESSQHLGQSRHSMSMTTTPPASPAAALAALHSSPTAMGIVSVVPELEDSMNSTVDWLDDHISRRLGKVTRVSSKEKVDGGEGAGDVTPKSKQQNVMGGISITMKQPTSATTQHRNHHNQQKRNSH